jgi:hypothetical protein
MRTEQRNNKIYVHVSTDASKFYHEGFGQNHLIRLLKRCTNLIFSRV